MQAGEERSPAPPAPREPSGACVEPEGFSLHAGVSVPGGCRQRATLERLCRYVAQPALASERLHEQPDGRLEYELLHPRADPLRRVFVLELLRCPSCSGRRQIVAAIPQAACDPADAGIAGPADRRAGSGIGAGPAGAVVGGARGVIWPRLDGRRGCGQSAPRRGGCDEGQRRAGKARRPSAEGVLEGPRTAKETAGGGDDTFALTGGTTVAGSQTKDFCGGDNTQP